MASNHQAAIQNIGLSEDLLRAAKTDLPFAALLEAQSRIVDLMASDCDLYETLDGISKLVEELAPPAMCSILLMEPDGQHLRVGSAKSLPDAYNEACKHGIPVGDFQGSCGTAAYRRQAVIVSDIETDPLWDVPPRPLVIAMGLRACWSMPILDDDGAVLGTVAIYYNERREPSGRDWGLLEPAARLIRLALAQQRKKDKLHQAESMKREAAALEVKRISLLSDMSQEILIIARDGIIVQVNAAGVRMLGGSGVPLIGRAMLELVSPADHPAVSRRLSGGQAALNHEEIHLLVTGDTTVPVEFSCSAIDYEGQPATVFAFRDLADRKRDEARIRHLAHHDALTDLPNRSLLNQRLTDAIGEARKSDTTLSLLYLDLDYFKPVNDHLGHAAGDALLIKVAHRLQAELRAGDTVARIGGDEFVIVTACDEPGYSAMIARRIINVLSQPFDIFSNRVEIGTSIGVATYPQDGESPEALLHAADTALYRAKHDKRGTVRFFEPALDEHSRARQRLERDLRHAVELEQMQLHYQPIVSCVTGDVVGFEALLRWNHPELGMVLPLDFIPLAERIGVIGNLGQWVIEAACKAAAGWKDPHWVAVNVSPIQFRVSDLHRIVCDALERTGLPADRLELEITEGTLMEDPKRADTMSLLREQGVRIALDDFGTGYSALGYLQKFRFDKLKIDRSFIARLGEADDATIIVRTIVGLAHNLGLSVTAEGVETPEQLALVRQLMCEEAQGFLLGRPLPNGAPSQLPSARVRHKFGRVKGAVRRSSLAAASKAATPASQTGTPTESARQN
jgi:diguanylate cyclase (GGDEF)-like protein/PAS domain S-box-containing protein